MSSSAGQVRIPVELEAEMTPRVRAFVATLLAEIDRLKEEVADLKKRLPKTPQNSSTPSGSQHPHAKPKRRKRKGGRKRGGQPGHAKHARPLRLTDECDDVVPLKPPKCRRCGVGLEGDDPDPLRHQIFELPVIQPHVTEYQRHRLTCSCCGQTTCAELPPDVPTGQSGPRLIAFTALLMAFFRQSKRRTALFLESLLGQPCCPALTVKHQKLATDALRPAYDEIVGQLPTQTRLGIDESPTKQASEKAWLWTFVAGTFTLFAVRTSRAAVILGELLTENFRGIVNCDRAKMYWSLERLQWCWAHLKRDFQALIDYPDAQVKRLGHDLMRQTKILFREWSRCRDGTITRKTMKRRLKPVRAEVESLLLRGRCSGNPRLVGMCRELYDHRQWLWNFLDHENVEPTNNGSERSLRHAVIWRKLSFGTQSAAGSRFVETMLTVIETCRKQSRDVFAYVTAAIQASFDNQPPPSLLPDP